MKAIQYLKGDATQPQADGNKIIAHVCNDVGGWGKGFVLALSKQWEKPEQNYREWYKSKKDFNLGAVQFVMVESDIWVANMIGQHGIKTKNNVPPIRYEAVKECLAKVADQAIDLNASVHMPRIGCGLAGGEWEKVEPLILEKLGAKDVQVFIYDLQ